MDNYEEIDTVEKIEDIISLTREFLLKYIKIRSRIMINWKKAVFA